MPNPANTALQETAAYLKYPIVLSDTAWLSAVHLDNPNRVGEMSLRLASVVQAAWQELKLSPDASKLCFCVVHKQTSGRERVWISLSLTVVRPEGETPYLLIELLEETSPEADQE